MAVTMSKKATILLLRNSLIYNTKALAIAGLESCINLVEDGAPLIARYKGEGNDIGAILGIKCTINNGTSNVSKIVIFDNLDNTSGDITTAITNAINALDMNAAVGGTGKMITTINETNGIVSATAVNADTDNLKTKDVTNITDGTTLTSALNTIYSAATTGSAVTLTSATGTGDVLKTYTLSQGGTTVGTIDIPKDLVVQSGSVVRGTWSNDTFTESAQGTQTALKLVIANQSSPIYINTADLVDIYEAGDGLETSSGKFKVKIDSTSEAFLTVSSGGLKLSGVQTAINTAAAGRLSNITVNGVTGTVSNGVSSVTVKTNNIKVNENIAAASSYAAIAANDTINTALSKLYKGIENNRINIGKTTVTNSDNSITVTIPANDNGTTDIKVNIVDCGTYTI